MEEKANIVSSDFLATAVAIITIKWQNCHRSGRNTHGRDLFTTS